MNVFICTAIKKGRYSGRLSIYYKQTLAKSVEIVETNQNGIRCVKHDKKLFSFYEDVYIINVYVPPTNSNVIDLNNFDLFDELETYLEKYKYLGKCLITGDFHSRCSNLEGFITFDNYLVNNNQLSNDVYIPPRVSKDHVIDMRGRRLIELFQSTSFILSDGR